MAAHDYSRNLMTAQRLIAKFGRVISLTLFSAEDLFDDDPTGPRDDATDTVVTDIYAVFVQPSGEQALGFKIERPELFDECAQIAIVAYDGTHAFEFFNTVTDGALTWKIAAVDKLQPGDTPLVYYLGLKV